MAWLPINQDLPSHRKTLLVAGAIGISPAVVVGHLVVLWLWAVDNAEDGILTNDPGLFNLVTGWKGEGNLFNAAIEAGFFDRDGDKVVIHNWADYAGKLIRQREVHRNRMRNARAPHVQRTLSARAPHVQRTLSARAPTTVEKSTEEKNTEEKSTNKPSVSPLQGERTKKVVYAPITDGYIEEMVVEFKDQFGDESRVREAVVDAMNHIAIDKRKDKRRYLKAWLQRDVERFASRNGSQAKGYTWADLFRDHDGERRS